MKSITELVRISILVLLCSTILMPCMLRAEGEESSGGGDVSAAAGDAGGDGDTADAGAAGVDKDVQEDDGTGDAGAGDEPDAGGSGDAADVVEDDGGEGATDLSSDPVTDPAADVDESADDSGDVDSRGNTVQVDESAQGDEDAEGDGTSEDDEVAGDLAEGDDSGAAEDGSGGDGDEATASGDDGGSFWDTMGQAASGAWNGVVGAAQSVKPYQVEEATTLLTKLLNEKPDYDFVNLIETAPDRRLEYEMLGGLSVPDRLHGEFNPAAVDAFDNRYMALNDWYRKYDDVEAAREVLAEGGIDADRKAWRGYYEGTIKAYEEAADRFDEVTGNPGATDAERQNAQAALKQRRGSMEYAMAESHRRDSPEYEAELQRFVADSQDDLARAKWKVHAWQSVLESMPSQYSPPSQAWIQEMTDVDPTWRFQTRVVPPGQPRQDTGD